MRIRRGEYGRNSREGNSTTPKARCGAGAQARTGGDSGVGSDDHAAVILDGHDGGLRRGTGGRGLRHGAVALSLLLPAGAHPRVNLLAEEVEPVVLLQRRPSVVRRLHHIGRVEQLSPSERAHGSSSPAPTEQLTQTPRQKNFLMPAEMRPPVELGFHRAPRCEPVVSLVRSRRAPPVPLIVLPKSCSCRCGPCPPPLSLVWAGFISSFLS